MLFKDAILARIVAGEITLAFRRWRKPAVLAGTELRTPRGVLRIESITETSLAKISARDAGNAGYASSDELLAYLAEWPHGTLYRIELRYHGADPRIALREQSGMDKDAFAVLCERLDAFDRRSPRGPWTRRLLALIEKHPAEHAGVLAKKAGCEKEIVKRDVRKLKELGLTESLPRGGYKLSARGKMFLMKLGSKKQPL